MQRWSFLVVLPRLSSSNPNFSKPRSKNSNFGFLELQNQEQQMSPCLNSCMRSRLTYQLLERWKFTIANTCIHLTKKQILGSWRWGLTIHPGKNVWLTCHVAGTSWQILCCTQSEIRGNQASRIL